jgi:cardiolipin-specific phospholipase
MGSSSSYVCSIAPQVEHIFVDSLEKWRKNMGMERMVLIGHSLGGYLSACYAMKYPERVEKLVLVSPVGLPEKPADFEESIEKRVCFGPHAGTMPRFQMYGRTL